MNKRNASCPQKIVCSGWEAFAPGLFGNEEFLKYLNGELACDEGKNLAPDVSKIPARLRRRMTYLTKMVVSTSFTLMERLKVKPDEPNWVFASEHGEIDALERLLGDLASSLPMSPVEFANSVHHTPLGYVGIAAGNMKISRTISAGHNTFAAGLLETIGIISAEPLRPVILCAADIPVPKEFGSKNNFPPFPLAVSMLFRADEKNLKNAFSINEIVSLFSEKNKDNNMLECQGTIYLALKRILGAGA